METGEVLVQPCDLNDDTRQAFAALLVPGVDTCAGLQSVDDLLDGAALFEWSRGGVVVAHHALTIHQRRYGNEGVIVGAAGRSPLPFARSLEIMENQFIDVRAITVHTKRMGMVRQLARCGYAVDAFIMRKRITRGES